MVYRLSFTIAQELLLLTASEVLSNAQDIREHKEVHIFPFILEVYRAR